VSGSEEPWPAAATAGVRRERHGDGPALSGRNGGALFPNHKNILASAETRLNYDFVRTHRIILHKNIVENQS
jgi:hypothetical protein